MTQKIIKQEQGRSMVEMLGTLAIIGVLSVGGIAGYTYAMNKYYANELLAGASERAVLVTAQIASGRKPSLKEFAKHTTAGGTFETGEDSVRVYSDGIGIKVSGVKGAVCKNLIQATEDTEVSIANTSDRILSEDDCDEENDNTLIITFESGIGNGETGNDICASEFVKIYDCEAKKMVNCCPDNGNSCEEPECSCDDDDDCLGQQVCSDGLCECPTDDYGNSGAPSTTDPGVCCRNGFAWNDMDDYYYDVNIACLDEGQEYYCSETDSDGDCYDWGVCDTGNNTGESIIGMPDAEGACADEGEELFCSVTNSDGECYYWWSCETGKSTGESIIGIPEAYGTCAGEGQEIYCYSTNGDGDCYDWWNCDTGNHTGDSIIGISYAYGACAGEGEEIYCRYTDHPGRCTEWSTCKIGKSGGDSIIGMPDAEGVCAGEGEEIYCMFTNGDGDCYEWGVCEIDKSSGDSIIGMPDAYGGCAGEGEEIYCYHTNSAGVCDYLEGCKIGKNSGDSIIGIPDATGACAYYEGYELYCAVTNSAGECTYWDICKIGKSVSASGPNARGTCN